MIRRTFSQIQEMVNGTNANGTHEALSIAGVSKDTRTIQPGNLYIPIIGEQFDGHDFAEEAVRRGAAAVLWQEDHHPVPTGFPVIIVDDALLALQRLAFAYRKQLNVRVIGITGSNGKTTTKDLLASLLRTTYKVHKTSGNLNGDIGLPLTLLEVSEDTEMVVLEMGMRARYEIELLSRLALPEVAIVTNIGESHIQLLGSREEIARAKLEILSGLKEGGLFVYNGDEPLIEQLLPQVAKPEGMLRYRFGSTDSSDIYPSGMMMDEFGTHFTIETANGLSYYIPILGQHNVINALAAITVSKYMGVSDADVMKGLKSVRLTGMRIEQLRAPSGLTILNDAYNASPTSTKAAIELLQQLEGYRHKIIVLGDMLELGDRENEYHEEIGKLLSSDQVDYVYAYGPLSRELVKAAEKRFHPGKVKWFETKAEIVREILRVTQPEDIVLVKASRGMKLEEVVNGLLELSS